MSVLQGRNNLKSAAAKCSQCFLLPHDYSRRTSSSAQRWTGVNGQRVTATDAADGESEVSEVVSEGAGKREAATRLLHGPAHSSELLTAAK